MSSSLNWNKSVVSFLQPAYSAEASYSGDKTTVKSNPIFDVNNADTVAPNKIYNDKYDNDAAFAGPFYEPAEMSCKRCNGQKCVVGAKFDLETSPGVQLSATWGGGCAYCRVAYCSQCGLHSGEFDETRD